MAADLYTGEEVVFDRGPLFEAIRASISIPSLFRPVKYGYRTLVDGGIVNTMPIDKAVRTEGDILVAFDVNDIDVDSIRNTIITEARETEMREEEERMLSDQTKAVVRSIRENDSLTFMDKLKLASAQGQRILASRFKDDEDNEGLSFEDNYYSILSRTFSIMNHVIARNAARQHKPDILVKMPFDAYDAITDYARADEISLAGRELMRAALDQYEKATPDTARKRG